MPQPRRAPQSEVERAGFDIGQRGLGGALVKYAPGMMLPNRSEMELARAAGRGLGRAAKAGARGMALLSGDMSALIPEIGVEPDEPIGDYARGLGIIETAPLPPQRDALAGRTVGQPSGRYARRPTIPEIGQPFDDEAARAGVRARAMRPPEIGAPIDPLSLSASQMEADFGAQEMLNARHAQRIESIDLTDPYLRARAAEGEAYAHTAGLEDLALVPEDEAPDTSIYQEGGVFKNRRAPRMTGREYKAALQKQLEGELAIGRAAIPEQMRAQAEVDRRQTLKKDLDKIDADHRQREDQLRQTHTGDQLALALEQLRKAREDAIENTLTAFQAGAKFNVKTDPSLAGPQ